MEPYLPCHSGSVIIPLLQLFIWYNIANLCNAIPLGLLLSSSYFPYYIRKEMFMGNHVLVHFSRTKF